MRLMHYTAAPFVFDRTRAYRQDPDRLFKPSGLWVSAETGDADSFGWRDWCEREEFRPGELSFATEIVLRPDADVLRLSTPEALDEFTRLFFSGANISLLAIDWRRVVHEHQGLIIAPYQWSRRHTHLWYYGWDCASGCIWDLAAVAEVRAERRALDLRETC